MFFGVTICIEADVSAQKECAQKQTTFPRSGWSWRYARALQRSGKLDGDSVGL